MKNVARNIDREKLLKHTGKNCYKDCPCLYCTAMQNINREVESGSLDADQDPFVKALTELCYLKIVKDTHGKTDDYLKRQPLAWETAFKLLNVPYQGKPE